MVHDAVNRLGAQISEDDAALQGAVKAQRAAIRDADKQEREARRLAIAQAAEARTVLSTATWDASDKSTAKTRPLTRRQRQRAAAAVKAQPLPGLVDQLVTREARRHGAYAEQTVPGPSIVEGGEERLTTTQVVVNRGGTAVERWFLNDRAGLFEEPQQQAVRYCRALWHRAGGLSAMDPTADRVQGVEGWSQQEALDELYDLKKRVPGRYWQVFENVCRFDEEAGVAGSSLASNSRSAVDAAKTCVAFTASLIALWRRL